MGRHFETSAAGVTAQTNLLLPRPLLAGLYRHFLIFGMSRPGLMAALLLAAAATAAAAASRPQRQLQTAAASHLTPFSQFASKGQAFAALSYLIPSGAQAAAAGNAIPLDVSNPRAAFAAAAALLGGSRWPPQGGARA